MGQIKEAGVWATRGRSEWNRNENSQVPGSIMPVYYKHTWTKSYLSMWGTQIQTSIISFGLQKCQHPIQNYLHVLCPIKLKHLILVFLPVGFWFSVIYLQMYLFFLRFLNNLRPMWGSNLQPQPRFWVACSTNWASRHTYSKFFKNKLISIWLERCKSSHNFSMVSQGTSQTDS